MGYKSCTDDNFSGNDTISLKTLLKTSDKNWFCINKTRSELTVRGRSDSISKDGLFI